MVESLEMNNLCARLEDLLSGILSHGMIDVVLSFQIIRPVV